MPADSYHFRPVPQEMSLGQLMAHIGGINLYACANASGLAPPALPPKIAAWAAALGKDTEKVEVDRNTAIQFLGDSSDFCVRAAASMTPERLDSVVGEVYLRVKGVKPPEYVF